MSTGFWHSDADSEEKTLLVVLGQVKHLPFEIVRPACSGTQNDTGFRPLRVCLKSRKNSTGCHAAGQEDQDPTRTEAIHQIKKRRWSGRPTAGVLEKVMFAKNLIR